MRGKNKQLILIFSLVILVFIINYSWMDSLVVSFFQDESQDGIVNRIVDGDTIYVNGESVRMLGINTPESKEELYQDAKENLNFLVNKTVKLVFGKDKKDRYNRTLAYIFLDNENINLKQVEEGFANPYFPSGRDDFYSEFYLAWENCINKNIGFCEKSQDKCVDCIKLTEFDKWGQEVSFENICSYSCDLSEWDIKDEGRKHFQFPENFILNSKNKITILIGEKENTNSILYWAGETYVWTSSGDALFLRDKEGKLVLWERY